MSTETTLWTLSNGIREIACVVRPLSGGAELAIIYYDGLPIGSRACVDSVDTSSWIDEQRSRWQRRGWISADRSFANAELSVHG
jgi:hypothetical protein